MKLFTSALLGIAAAQLLVVSAQADQPKNYGFYGSLEFFYQHGKDDYWDDYGPFDGWGGGGSLAYWINPNVSVQADVSIDTFKSKSDDYFNFYDLGSRDLAFHVSYRQPGNFQLGAMAQLSGTADAGYDGTLVGYVFAAEGGIDFDRLAILARAGYAGSLIGDNLDYMPFNYDFSVYFGEIEAKYFLLDNLEFSGGLGFMTGDYYEHPEYDATAMTWNAEVAYQPDFLPTLLFGAPMSVFAGVDGLHMTDKGIISFEDVYTVKAGIRFNFGADTLVDAHRYGTNFDEFDMKSLYWMRWN